ncbi:MAG: response regulator [Elusimicrobiota bacterium]|jgi:two-component system alkaline phosphatase synthesis response regulator PhoP
MSEPQPYRILLVDDEKNFLYIFMDYLQYSGYDVLAAADGEEALELLQTEHFDIVLLDLGMPKVDGWQVCESIRRDPKTSGLPVILLTAYGGAANHKRAAELKVQVYITKPCEPSELVKEIKRCLGPI